MSVIGRSGVRFVLFAGWWLIVALFALGAEHRLATTSAKVALNENCAFWMVALEQGQTIAFPRRLEGGVRYRFFVMGDAQSDDVAVEVLDPLGSPIARNGGTAQATLLRFTPAITGSYTVRVTMRRSRGLSLCSALILSEQGDWLDVQQHWSEALRKVQGLLQTLEAHGIPVEFRTPGIWMVGGLVAEGRVMDFGDFAINTTGSHLWAAVGDHRARSVQLRLQRHNGDASKRSRSGGTLALTLATEQGVYAPQVSFRGDAPESFIIVAILPAPSLPASRTRP